MTATTITIADLVDRALAAHADLATLGESVEDEWQYIQDLGAVWAARLREVSATRGTAIATDAQVTALELLAGESARVTDPHRAIDWLSTFPQAALLALGEGLG